MNKNKGTSIEDFLLDEGIADKVEAIAIKRVIAYQIEQGMLKEKISKSKMAEKMKTSRSALDHLLDENNTSITLTTLAKAAHVLGKKLNVTLG